VLAGDLSLLAGGEEWTAEWRSPSRPSWVHKNVGGFLRRSASECRLPFEAVNADAGQKRIWIIAARTAFGRLLGSLPSERDCR
jgi:hypothetical protein